MVGRNPFGDFVVFRSSFRIDAVTDRSATFPLFSGARRTRFAPWLVTAAQHYRGCISKNLTFDHRRTRSPFVLGSLQINADPESQIPVLYRPYRRDSTTRRIDDDTRACAASMNPPDRHGSGHGSDLKQPTMNTPPLGTEAASKQDANGVIQAGLRSLDHCMCAPYNFGLGGCTNLRLWRGGSDDGLESSSLLVISRTSPISQLNPLPPPPKHPS